MKLNVLLALTDTLRVVYKNMVSDYSKYFKNSQSDFQGVKKTYTAKEGVVDDPSKRKMVRVATTVKEKLDWFIEKTEQFVDATFAQEATNASGNAIGELIVDSKSWGNFTSLELLRLKNFIENSDLGNIGIMLSLVPTRSDSEVWDKTDDEDYTSREIFETEMVTGVNKTTVKEEYILEDPNVKNLKDTSGYHPPIATKNTILELGDYTSQNFSGQWSHRERAEALARKQTLVNAVTVALKQANECDIVDSELKAKKIFGYLFFGTQE